MTRLIEDLLEFSRSSRKLISAEQIDTGRLVGGVIDELRGHFPGRWPAVTVDQLPPAAADRTLIHQVWVNLISNAVKFSAKAPAPAIRICGRTEAGEVIFSVQDNGAGFDMRYYDKLFGVFQRLHSTDEFLGTGVGLAIVQRVVARHGGRVWAEGKPGEGATFHFSLPAGGG
jgi:light-regulated signal transduction histidine kinase (bacteriophytochrome)